MDVLMKICVCVGSSCHLKGSYDIINLMKANGIIIRSAFYYILLPSLFAMALPLLLYELLELHDRRRL